MTLFGYDASGPVNAAGLRSSGCTFGLARVVEETRQIDPAAVGEIGAAIAAGLIPGGYHWLMPQDGADQAALYLRTVRPFMDPAHGFVVWLDCEASSVDPDTGKPYHPDPTWADAAAWIAAFRAIEPDWPIGLYGNVPFLTSRAFGMPAGALAALHNVYLVVAAYPSRPPTLAHPGDAYPGDTALDWSATVGGLRPSMWQYVGTTHLAGQSVDLSAFRGDAAALHRLAGGTELDASLTPTALVDLKAGGTLYADLACTQVIAPNPYPGAKSVGTYGTAPRPKDGVVMRALRVQLASGGPFSVAWYGDTLCTLVDPTPYSAADLAGARTAAATAQKQADIAAATTAAVAAIKAI